MLKSGGEWGLDFIIILINTLLFVFLKTKNTKHLYTAIAIIILLPVYGLISNNLESEKPFSKLDTIIIQPCIYDGDLPEVKRSKFFTLLKKIEDKCKNKVLIIPESSLPDDIQRSYERDEIMRAILNRFKLNAILYNTIIEENDNVFNSNILLTENSKDRYDKNHLMLFGEYFPFHSIIQKLPLAVANYENFTAGKKVKPLQFGKIKIATPICLENIFQGYVAKISKNANLIVNQTDDEWFLSKKAKMLHLAQARLKAIENNRYLIRATNNGYTVLINPEGKIVKDLIIDKAGFLKAKIPLLKKQTIFQKIYPFIPYIFLFIFIILLVISGKDEKSNNS
ncbi:apolipoprotein N-acyltransferase [Thermotomaculum hydrothermale]|uniref:apolipoprotein N-acyltransferase n=1 Tax=Thermotomaculum hydrothermale TaxID=981385 RepID=UPI0019155423|nr:apolipoprotein N-acyltransferase [Thermotomaculum hydrothermale]